MILVYHSKLTRHDHQSKLRNFTSEGNHILVTFPVYKFSLLLSDGGGDGGQQGAGPEGAERHGGLPDREHPAHVRRHREQPRADGEARHARLQRQQEEQGGIHRPALRYTQPQIEMLT